MRLDSNQRGLHYYAVHGVHASTTKVLSTVYCQRNGEVKTTITLQIKSDYSQVVARWQQSSKFSDTIVDLVTPSLLNYKPTFTIVEHNHNILTIIT